jgi:hypothetical protein
MIAHQMLPSVPLERDRAESVYFNAHLHAGIQLSLDSSHGLTRPAGPPTPPSSQIFESNFAPDDVKKLADTPLSMLNMGLARCSPLNHPLRQGDWSDTSPARPGTHASLRFIRNASVP